MWARTAQRIRTRHGHERVLKELARGPQSGKSGDHQSCCTPALQYDSTAWWQGMASHGIRTSRPHSPGDPPTTDSRRRGTSMEGKGITMWRQLELIFFFPESSFPSVFFFPTSPFIFCCPPLSLLLSSGGLPIRSLAALPRSNSRFLDLFQHRHSSRAHQGHPLCISSPDPIQPERLQVRAPLPASSLSSVFPFSSCF
ncbi:hypothetical protein PVAP13_3KG017094 [Panicum virgatum]|uniref:Uncharacterized protein n=1 Tax=Panicum virgatum TaxID=38727 RepID=A0A8T0UPS6_PANVG|nr:hypothetical protein PVAP13_3KG017094 [Panicum virgatum]